MADLKEKRKTKKDLKSKIKTKTSAYQTGQLEKKKKKKAHQMDQTKNMHLGSFQTNCCY